MSGSSWSNWLARRFGRPGAEVASRAVSTELRTDHASASDFGLVHRTSGVLPARPSAPVSGVAPVSEEPPSRLGGRPGGHESFTGRFVSADEKLGQQFSDMLVQAISTRDPQDDRLAVALRPVVEKALRASVQTDPKFAVDLLFPLIGPAIRRAVAEALRSMVASFGQALAMTFSWRYIKWRIEAIRTGLPFPEVVFLHTLAYRVEQLFLLHRSNGVVLRHLSAAGVATQDADMVAGMLTAIQDFVHDSFGNDGEMLESFRVGELGVWIEQGPYAVVAAVVRGIPPVDFSTLLRTQVELIERDWRPELAHFDGDTAPFAEVDMYLAPCMIAA